MESPGQYLKRERELRGISLAKVHEVTRVQRKYLEAIESDDYDNLPSPAFVKGFIKSYCKHLGLDEDDAVLRYEIFTRDRTTERTAPEKAAAFDEPYGEAPGVISGARPSGSRNIILYLVAAGFIIIILFYAFSSWRGTEVEPVASAPDVAEEVEKPAASAPPAAEAPGKPAPAVVPAKAPEKSPPVVAKPSGDAKPAAATGAKGHSLTIEATEMSWVEVRIDGEEPFDVMLKQGEKLSWAATDKFVLVIGNAGGVNIEFDGKGLGPLGPSGNVARLELSAEGVKKRVSAPKPEPEEVEQETPGAEGQKPGATGQTPSGQGVAPGPKPLPEAEGGAVGSAAPAGAAGVASGPSADKIGDSPAAEDSGMPEAQVPDGSGGDAGPGAESPEDEGGTGTERKPFMLDWQ